MPRSTFAICEHVALAQAPSTESAALVQTPQIYVPTIIQITLCLCARMLYLSIHICAHRPCIHAYGSIDPEYFSTRCLGFWAVQRLQLRSAAPLQRPRAIVSPHSVRRQSAHRVHAMRRLWYRVPKIPIFKRFWCRPGV